MNLVLDGFVQEYLCLVYSQQASSNWYKSTDINSVSTAGKTSCYYEYNNQSLSSVNHSGGSYE